MYQYKVVKDGKVLDVNGVTVFEGWSKTDALAHMMEMRIDQLAEHDVCVVQYSRDGLVDYLNNNMSEEESHEMYEELPADIRGLAEWDLVCAKCNHSGCLGNCED